MTARDFASRHLPLAAILVLALTLRLVGLGWSLPTPDHRHPPFHPDEKWAMRNLTLLDVSAGTISPGPGQREGALYYYIWLAAVETARLVGSIEKHPWELERYGTGYAAVLLIGRLLNVLYECLTLVFIYLTLLKITDRRIYALSGAAIFAVLPFEIIYAHFVRTHALANLFVSVIVFLAFRLSESRNKVRDWFVLGTVTGLAIAARWPTGFVFVVPMIAALMQLGSGFGLRWRSVRACRAELRKQASILSALPGILVGVFVGNPTIFLSFDTVRRHLEVQMKWADAGEFSSGSLLEVEKLWTTLHYLIPQGTLPLLWLLLYSGAVWSLSSRAKLQLTLPLFAYVLPYLYLMAKGYRFDSFVREAMPTFPALVILAVVGLEALMVFVGRRRAVRGGVWAGVWLTVATTGWFSFDYVASMARPDPREEMHRFIEGSREMRGQSIALFPSGLNYFVVEPALADLEATGITTRRTKVNLRDLEEEEYLLIGDHQGIDRKERLSKVRARLNESMRYTLMAEFDNTPRTMLWVRRHFGLAPHDMQYPFPILSLYRRNARRGVGPAE